MPIFVVRYRPGLGRAVERVVADELCREGSFVHEAAGRIDAGVGAAGPAERPVVVQLRALPGVVAEPAELLGALAAVLVHIAAG